MVRWSFGETQERKGTVSWSLDIDTATRRSSLLEAESKQNRLLHK
jgi:hypothetical protein